MGGSFSFGALEIPVKGDGGIIEARPSYYLKRITVSSQKIQEETPKLAAKILETKLKGYWDFEHKIEPIGSVVNVKVAFTNPRESEVHIRCFKLDANPAKSQITIAEQGEIYDRPDVKNKRVGERLENLNKCPVLAQHGQPFEGWLQFIVLGAMPLSELNNTTPTLLVIDESGEQHRVGVPPLVYDS
jgi:hypothetical protein